MQSQRGWILSAALLSLAWLGGCAQEKQDADNLLDRSRPATIWDDPETLARVKAEFAAGVGPNAALKELIHEADDVMKNKPVSVMDKGKAGPSGDIHDYVSYAPYYWPNPKTKDGLPFINRDGYRNQKQVSLGDADTYKEAQWGVHTLGLAYWYTGNSKYAERAAELARTWFLDPATRMNPNFQYAQAVLGTNDGRGIGIIENRGLLQMLDGIALIQESGMWKEKDQTELHAWVAAFDHWMTTSDPRAGRNVRQNNHGSWYAVQESGLYIWLGETAHARAVYETAKTRILKQIEPTGRQPLEIVREDGFGYSVFNIQALSLLASMAERQNVDLWHFEQNGRGLQKAIDYLMPFANGSQKWRDNQLKKIDAEGLSVPVMMAARVYGDQKYAAWLASQKDDLAASQFHLTGE